VVKIRLQRVGTKNSPSYRVIAVDERKKRDGAVLDNLGQYQPISKASQFTVNEESIINWLKKGAQPTLTVLNLLKKNGIWSKYTAK
jgi:small subunit ribosomal protein S16